MPILRYDLRSQSSVSDFAVCVRPVTLHLQAKRFGLMAGLCALGLLAAIFMRD